MKIYKILSFLGLIFVPIVLFVYPDLIGYGFFIVFIIIGMFAIIMDFKDW